LQNGIINIIEIIDYNKTINHILKLKIKMY